MDLQTYLMIKQAISAAGVEKFRRLARNKFLKSRLPEQTNRIINGNINYFGLKFDEQVANGELQRAIKNGINRGTITAGYGTYSVSNPYTAFMPAAESVGVAGASAIHGMRPIRRPWLGAVEVSMPSAINNYWRSR